jgi:hypothetical protein
MSGLESFNLHEAIKNVMKDKSAESFNKVKRLIEDGADINIKNRLGLSPLHLNVSISHPYRIEIIQLLIEHGANVNTQDNGGDTLLHYLIEQRNNDECIQILIEKGAYIDIPNKKGEIVLNEVIHLVPDDINPFAYQLKYGVSGKNFQDGSIRKDDFAKVSQKFRWGGGKRKKLSYKKRNKCRNTCKSKTRQTKCRGKYSRSRRNITKRARKRN